jgi:hypothetical protein
MRCEHHSLEVWSERPSSESKLGRLVVKAILVFAAAVITALVVSSAAFANSVTCSHGSNCHSGNLGTPTHTGGTLPFTGLDLAGIAGVAGLLLVGGVTLRRASRSRR